MAVYLVYPQRKQYITKVIKDQMHTKDYITFFLINSIDTILVPYPVVRLNPDHTKQ
jgi:hypothetical protein